MLYSHTMMDYLLREVAIVTRYASYGFTVVVSNTDGRSGLDTIFK